MAEATEPEGPRTKKRQRAKTAYSLALAFHTLGDALLIFSGTAFFLGGMGAFFAGHIFYLLLFFSFWPRLTHGRKAAFHALLVPLMISGALAVKTLMRLEAPLALPVCLYAATLLSMLWTGLFGARVLGRTWLLVAAGAALFIVSDSLIGINSFLGISFPFRGLAVMATYIPAQVLLTIGVVRIHRSASGAWSEESGTVDSKTHDQ